MIDLTATPKPPTPQEAATLDRSEAEKIKKLSTELCHECRQNGRTDADRLFVSQSYLHDGPAQLKRLTKGVKA